MVHGERKSLFSDSGIRERFSSVRGGSERCENDAWEMARLGAPGLGGCEERLFQHCALVEIGEPVIEVEYIQCHASAEGWAVVLLVDEVVPGLKGHG